MKTQTAIRAGVTGALAMTAFMAVARMGNYPANLEMMLGTMLGLAPSLSTWIIGLVIHLFAGAVFGLIYAYGFEHLTHRAGWVIGSGFALAHTVVSGLLLQSIPATHPMIPEVLPAPGAFMANVPGGPIVFFVLHVLFGAIVGMMYGPVLHRRQIHAH